MSLSLLMYISDCGLEIKLQLEVGHHGLVRSWGRCFKSQQNTYSMYCLLYEGNTDLIALALNCYSKATLDLCVESLEETK